MVTLNRKGLLEEKILELIRENKVFKAFTESLPENVISKDIVVSFDYQPIVDNEYRIEKCVTYSSTKAYTREPMNYPSEKRNLAGRIKKGRIQYEGEVESHPVWYYSED